MAWDAGTEVAVAGQPFGGALQLVNEASREDAIDRRIASGGRQFVQGWARRTGAGVTALRIGLETQTEARGAAVVTYYAIPLPAVGTWAAFSAWITMPAGHVWARPYLQAVGGTGEFAEIYIGPAQPGATAGADWTEVTDSAGTRPANNATVGAVFGTNLLETTGGATATLAAFKTALGVASAVTGQTAWATYAGAIGALASKSAVDLSTSEVANKSLANLDATANTKLGGIAAGATVGAIFGTNLLETSGGTTATLANFKTSLGVASAVTGQTAWATYAGAIGALASKGSVDFATSEVTNRTAGNLTYSGGATVESLKPAQAAADKTSSNVASAVVGQGPLAISPLTEAQVQGRWLGDYSGDAAANAAGLQAGDVYLDTSVFPNRVRAKKPGGAIQTVSLAPGTVSNTGTGTSAAGTWKVAARMSLTNLQDGSLVMASGELYPLPSNGTSLANSTGFQGRAKLYEATPGQTDFSVLDPARAIGDEWLFTVLNDGSNFASPDFTSTYDSPGIRRLKSTPSSDIVLLIKRETGTNNVTNLGARVRPTVFGV